MRAYLPLAIGLLLLIALIGAYGYGYYALTKESAQDGTLTQQVNHNSTAEGQAALAHAELLTLASKRTTLDTYIVNTSDVVTFLENLQSTGKPLGSTIDVVSVADDTSGGQSHIDVSLSITGSFDAVMRTLGAIEYGPYDGVVQNLSLDIPTQNGSASGKDWTATLVLSVASLTTSATSTKP